MSTPARKAGRCGVPGAGGAAAGLAGAGAGAAAAGGVWAGAGAGEGADCHASACDHWVATTATTARTTKSLAPINPSRSVLPACLGPTNRQTWFPRRYRHLVRRNQRFGPAVHDLVLRAQFLREPRHRP